LSRYHVALISRSRQDREAVRAALEGSVLHLVAIESLDHPLRSAANAAIILWDADLSDWPWQEFLAHIHRIPKRPRFILLTSVPNPMLWAEAINLGVDDVLAKPLDPSEIRHVIACADFRKPPVRERKRYHAAAAPSIA
jgi:response regulator RpfG family c-di-GMP phosphodiesterase